jgi:hypothetical protein
VRTSEAVTSEAVASDNVAKSGDRSSAGPPEIHTAPARPDNPMLTAPARSDLPEHTLAALAAPARSTEHSGTACATLAAPVLSDLPEHTLAAPARSGLPEQTVAALASALAGGASHPPRSAPRPHLPAALRRDVWQRDAGRCTFVDSRGLRCPSTAALEFHHRQAHALGGPSTRGNLTLRCRAHNRLAAERDFGAEHVAERAARAGRAGSRGP